MKPKNESSCNDELHREYTRSDFPSGFLRGKYAAAIAAGSKSVELVPETNSVARSRTVMP